MTIIAYILEYLDGSFEYIPRELLRGILKKRRNKKPCAYRKVVLSKDEAIRKRLTIDSRVVKISA